MRYGSVCSGIEAASVAWHALGWEPAFFSEIEAFPSDVLRRRFPGVPNLGDMTKYKEWPDAALDVLVGGTPCQAFSVAGLREGLDDPRGNLMLTFAAIARKYRPRWLVWENVPGVLSSGEGRDFGSLLGILSGRRVVAPAGVPIKRQRDGGTLLDDSAPAAVDDGASGSGWENSGIVPGHESGYGLAWRVLDAQYFGVAQRRRRVFLVGHLGDWRRAAAVLLELSSLRGDPPPSRGARKGAAARAPGGAGESRDEVAGSLTTRTRGGTADDLSDGHLIHSAGELNDVAAATLDAEHPASGQRAASEGALVFDDGPAHTLRGEGHDASDDGTRQTIVGTLTADSQKCGRPALDANLLIAVNGAGGGGSESVAPTLPGSHLDRVSDTAPLVFETRYARNGRGAPGEVAAPLKPETGSSGRGDGAPCVVVNMQGGKGQAGASEDVCPTLGADRQMHGVTVPFYDISGACHTMMEQYGDFTGDSNETRLVGFSCKDAGADAGDDVAPTLRAMGGEQANGGGQAAVAFDARQSFNDRVAPVDTDGHSNAVHGGMRVRRLTPLECERLQGFPDEWTLIDRAGRDAADGPRYKAIGNSMAVPVMRWIGRRIMNVEALVAGRVVEDIKAAVGEGLRDAVDAYVLRTHNLHDEEKGDVWLSDIPGALNATGSTPNQFDAVVYEAGELAVGYDPQNSEVTGDVSMTVSAAAGTSGNRGPHVVIPINADALREGTARTPIPDAEGRVRLRDPGLGIGRDGDPAGTISAAGHGAVAIIPAPGRCAKTHVTCTIVTHDKRTVIGSNECANPQPKCPRAPGEGYEKCSSICRQRGHAEVVALELAREAGLDLKGAVAVLAGHYYACEPCARRLRDAGFARIQVVL